MEEEEGGGSDKGRNGEGWGWGKRGPSGGEWDGGKETCKARDEEREETRGGGWGGQPRRRESGDGREHIHESETLGGERWDRESPTGGRRPRGAGGTERELGSPGLPKPGIQAPYDKIALKLGLKMPSPWASANVERPWEHFVQI